MIKLIFVALFGITSCVTVDAAQEVYIGGGRYGCRGDDCVRPNPEQMRRDERAREVREQKDRWEAERIREDRRDRMYNDKSVVK